MRILLSNILTLMCFTAYSQLYSSYKKEGRIDASGGPNFYRIEFFLREDNSFIRTSQVFDSFEKKFPIEIDSAIGVWFEKGDTLELNFTGYSIRTERYFVGRKKIKLLFKERSIFIASGSLLNTRLRKRRLK